MNWDDYRYFLAIARARTLTEAAKALGVSQPTVSRRLKAMEDGLGVRLLEHTPSGYVLSAPGMEIVEAVEQIEDELNSIDRKVFGQDRRLTGAIRITCTEVMANLYLAPHLADFLVDHPEIDLSVICTFQHLSLGRREADIAVRVASRPPDTLVGRRLAKAALGVYASPSETTHAVDGSGPADWTWIGWQDEAYDQLTILSSYPQARIRHRVDDLQTMRAMAQQGLGVVALPCYVSDPDPELRRIIAEPVVETAPDLWVLTHPDVRQVARVRLFTDFIAQRIHADRDLFEGRRTRSNALAD